jgi:hypothetical protein
MMKSAAHPALVFVAARKVATAPSRFNRTRGCGKVASRPRATRTVLSHCRQSHRRRCGGALLSAVPAGHALLPAVPPAVPTLFPVLFHAVPTLFRSDSACMLKICFSEMNSEFYATISMKIAGETARNSTGRRSCRPRNEKR